MMGDQATTNGRDRTSGFNATCMKERFPDIKVIEQPTYWKTDRATSVAQTVVTSTPDLAGIYMQSDAVMLAGVLSVLESAGKLKAVGEPEHLYLISIDGTPFALKKVREGWLDAAISQPLNLYVKYGLAYCRPRSRASRSSRTDRPRQPDRPAQRQSDGPPSGARWSARPTSTTRRSGAIRSNSRDGGTGSRRRRPARRSRIFTAPSASPVAETIGVSKRFGASQALDDVSLVIPAGDSRALVGRNGAGKSTLVAVADPSLLAPDAGQVRLAGEGAPRLADRQVGASGSPASIRSRP